MTTTAHPVEKKLSRKQRLLLIVLPAVGFFVAYGLAYVLAGARRSGEMVAAALANVAGLGTTVILGGALGRSGFANLSAWDLAIVVLVLDGLLTVMYLGAGDQVERIPWLGPKLASMRRKARSHAKQHRWMHHWAALGVALFVLSPIPGSGVLPGSVIGHIVGLTRWRTFATVMAADAVVCCLYAWGADALGAWMSQNDWTLGQRLALLGGVVVVILVLLKLVTGGFHREKPAAK